MRMIIELTIIMETFMKIKDFITKHDTDNDIFIIQREKIDYDKFNEVCKILNIDEKIIDNIDEIRLNSPEIMTQSEYEDLSTTCCPFCRSENIEVESINPNSLSVYGIVHCENCGMKWAEVFEYKYYELITR